jgi:hypothetical protein
MADASLWQTAVVSLGSALVGGYFVHLLSGLRERNSKRRELVTKYLIEIWQTIESVNKSKENDALLRFEKPVADIQLFGSDSQIEIVHSIVNEIVKNQTSDTTDLLVNLRDSLRNELGLPKLSHKFFWFRSIPIASKSEKNIRKKRS